MFSEYGTIILVITWGPYSRCGTMVVSIYETCSAA